MHYLKYNTYVTYDSSLFCLNLKQIVIFMKICNVISLFYAFKIIAHNFKVIFNFYPVVVIYAGLLLRSANG